MTFKYRDEEDAIRIFGKEVVEEMHRRDENGYYYEHPEELGDGSGNVIPPGCRTCGGNYPLCADSCKIFDND